MPVQNRTPGVKAARESYSDLGYPQTKHLFLQMSWQYELVRYSQQRFTVCTLQTYKFS